MGCEDLREISGKITESSDKSDYDLSLHGKLEESFARYKNKGSEKWWKEMAPCTGQSSSSKPSSTPSTSLSTRNFMQCMDDVTTTTTTPGEQSTISIMNGSTYWAPMH